VRQGEDARQRRPSRLAGGGWVPRGLATRGAGAAPTVDLGAAATRRLTIARKPNQNCAQLEPLEGEAMLQFCGGRRWAADRHSAVTLRRS